LPYLINKLLKKPEIVHSQKLLAGYFFGAEKMTDIASGMVLASGASTGLV